MLRKRSFCLLLLLGLLSLALLTAAASTPMPPPTGTPTPPVGAPEPQSPGTPAPQSVIEIHADDDTSHDSKSIPINAALPIPVNCALQVIELAKISEQTETFSASISLRLIWQDPRLAFEVSNIDRYEYSGAEAAAKLEEIWTPEISLDNLAGDPVRDEIGLIIFSDGSVTYIRTLSGEFSNEYNLADFPLDKQLLIFHIASRKYNTSQVMFSQIPDDLAYSGLQPGVKLAGWQNQTKVRFDSFRFRGWNGAYYPQINASVLVQREPLNIIPVIFVPLFLIFLTAMIPLWADGMGTTDRINSIAGSMLALIAFNFTVTLTYPMLGADSSVIQIFWVGFGFLWANLLVAMTVLNPFIARYLGDEYAVAEFADFLKWSIPATLVIILLRIMLLVII
jgi:hypothetical protein